MKSAREALHAAWYPSGGRVWMELDVCGLFFEWFEWFEWFE